MTRHLHRQAFLGIGGVFLGISVVVLTGALIAGVSRAASASPDRDCYLTPQGAGSMDGSSWDNAFPGDLTNGLQRAWDATGPTNTLHVGSGTYTVPQTLSVSTGGSDRFHPKKLVGEDTGGGLPVFRGNWSLTNQISRRLIDVLVGVSFWQIQDIRIENYRYPIYARGQNVGVRILNVNMTNMEDGVYLWGMPSGSGSDPNVASHDVVIKDSNFSNYTKSGTRFRDGTYLVSVINCTADGGGKDNWDPFPDSSNNFPISYRVGGSSSFREHDIVFQDVVGRNNYQESPPGGYWNSDGFSVERSAYNVTYIRSKAFGNTDGGWDDKSENPVYIDTVAFGNKRNYRVWSWETAEGLRATYIRAIAGYSISRGGTGDSVGLWVGGGNASADVFYSTFYNNQNAEVALEDAARVSIYDSIVAKTNGISLYRLTRGVLDVVNSEEYIAGIQGMDPQILNGANSAWEGGSTDFNNQVYGDTKGYHYPGPNNTSYTIEITPANPSPRRLDQEERTLTAHVRDGDGKPVTDPEKVIWYSNDAWVARLLQSRGASATVQGLNPGATEIVAVYKGEEARVAVSFR
jgi:hypothetical protein